MFRSQVGELFYNALTHTEDARSAGVDATLLDHASRRAEAVMQEIGMTLQGKRSDQVTEEMVEWTEKVILFRVQEQHIPTFLKDNEKIEVWDIEDLGHGKEGETVELDREVRDAIRQRVAELVVKVGKK